MSSDIANTQSEPPPSGGGSLGFGTFSNYQAVIFS
jgi:hypothetical protein